MLTNKDIFFKHMGLPSRHSLGLEITDAEGIYLTARDGKKYTDLVSGVAVSNLGHKNPVIINAVKEQAEKYMHLMVYGEMIQSPQIRLAKLLSEKYPEPIDTTYFVSSGSEAIEGAMKLAKRYTGRTDFVSFKNAYHGGTQGALSILGNEKLKYAFRPLIPGIRHLNFNSLEDLGLINKNTAAVIIETIQAEAGIILPENGYLKAVRERCYQTGSLLIIDDIQMGFGRTGKLFSFENFGIVPDILCIAKAMGAGMPIGAFASSGEIMKSLTNNPELGHITTFGGHPVSCAAALAGLEILSKSDLIKEANTKGKMFYDRLIGHKEVKEIRYKGLMLGIELGSADKAEKMTNLLLESGMIVDRFLFNARSFRIAPPLVVIEDEIELICKKVIECLDQLGNEY